MNDVADNELERFLAAHPSVRFFDAFVNDLNTVERGKRIDRGGIARVFERGMPLPGSMFALDIEGGTIEATGLGFEDGDADRPCLPIPGTLVPVPWQQDVAQVQLCMHDFDGTRFFGDPRTILEAQVAAFTALGLTPVVAIEYEFYLVDLERGVDGLPQPPRGPLTGRREYRTQINSMTDLNEYSALLAEIDRRLPAAERARHLVAGRIRTRTIRGESRARARCPARVRRGDALQTRGEERRARARMRSHIPAEALSGHGR